MTLDTGALADIFGNTARPSAPENVLYSAEITLLGIGNVILRDEGFGVRVAEYLDAHYSFPENLQIVDGGTLGIELTQYLTGTQKLIVFDSIKSGKEKGTRFRIEDDAVMAHFQDKLSAHEVGIQDVLGALTVTGLKIPKVVVLGAEPYDLEAGVSLSPEMERLVPQITEEALGILKDWGIEARRKDDARTVDYRRITEEGVKSAVPMDSTEFRP